MVHHCHCTKNHRCDNCKRKAIEMASIEKKKESEVHAVVVIVCEGKGDVFDAFLEKIESVCEEFDSILKINYQFNYF